MVEFDVPADKVDYVTCGTFCKSVRFEVVCAKTTSDCEHLEPHVEDGDRLPSRFVGLLKNHFWSF
jgi:hypothetical protein